MKRVILVLLLVSAFACKSDKKTETQDQNTEEEAVKEEVYEGYIMSLEAEVLKDDTFLINYLSEYEEENQFIKKNNIITKVKGQSGVQSIKFKLPDDVYDLRRLRMNFGKNRAMGSILVENITIEKAGKKWVMKSDDIFRYFGANGYLSIDEDGKIFKFMEKEGSYNPFIISKWSIESAINKKLKQ